MQKAVSNTRKTITVSHSAIRHFLARLHSLVAAVCRRYQCGINGFDSWGGSYGHCIQIGHGGGLETLYAHCSSICVTIGQQVQAGQVIGYVGHTGQVMGNHLHLEVRINGSRTDAMAYFS